MTTTEIWTCDQCDWAGTRYTADSHLRANWNHGVSPKPETIVHACGTKINARSLWCYGCKSTVVPEEAK